MLSINATPNGAQVPVAKQNGHSSRVEYSNGINGHHADTPEINQLVDIEVQLLALMKYRRGVISRVCKQAKPLTRLDFNDEAAGCIYGACACATDALGTATRTDVLRTLETWTREETDTAPLAAQGLAFWEAIEEPTIAQDDAPKFAIDLARQIQQRGHVQNATSSTRKEKQSNDAAPTPEPRKRFTILAAAQMMEQESPEEIIDGIFYKATTVCLSGAFASYKSFIVKSMAYAVAGGHQWHGRDVRKCPVLIITAEGVSGNKQRIRALEIRHNHPMEASYLPQAVQMHRPDEVAALLLEIFEMPELPGVIVVDTLARCFVGGDENSARDAGLFNAGIDRLRDATGATIIVLHHVGKSGDTRGSTAFTGAFDTVIELKRRDSLVTLKCLKQKDAAEFEPITLIKRVVELDIEDRKGNLLTSLVFDSTDTPAVELPRADKTRDAILNVLREARRPLKSGEWQGHCLDKLAVSGSSFDNYRRVLIDSGAVEKSGALYLPKNPKNPNLGIVGSVNSTHFPHNSIELGNLGITDDENADEPEMTI